MRRFGDVISESDSVDVAMAELEPFMDPEIEFVNPLDAVERGTRKGIAGMRTAFENFLAGVGARATIEIEKLESRGDRVYVRARVHARGGASGAEAVGPHTAMICTLRDGRVLRMEWHYDLEAARARFDEEN